MKLKIQFALTAVLISILIHAYLSSHYYPLKFGLGDGDMICNINSTFNCASVSASSYSAALGIPLSVWGLVANSILFLSLLFYWLGWTETPARLQRFNLWLASTNLLASFIMGGISLLFMSTYCLFCIFLYVLSIISFECIRRTQEGPVLKEFTSDLISLFTESKTLLVGLISIPASAFLIHQSIVSHYGADELDRVVNSLIQEWKQSPQNNFTEKPSLVTGPENAAMTITEFADFRCGHCRQAAPSLHAFISSRPDVRFVFYTFPLDGQCNEAIPNGDGISCRLAKAVYCAGQDNKGWPLHDEIFSQQDKFHEAKTVADTDNELKKLITPMGVNWEKLVSCMDAAETHSIIIAQGKAGIRGNVRGTPTIFVNGRKLERGQLIPVLQETYKNITN